MGSYSMNGTPAKGSCATDGCQRQAFALFERGSVISKYCKPCFEKASALARRATLAQGQKEGKR